MNRKRHETGTEPASLTHNETLKKIMDDAIREYHTKRVRISAFIIGPLVILGALVAEAEYSSEQTQTKLNNYREAIAVVDALENPEAIRALDVTPQAFQAVAEAAARNARSENGSLAAGYNSLAWYFRNAATMAEAASNTGISADSRGTLSYTVPVGKAGVSLTAVDILGPSPAVVADIGQLETETPISAR